MQNNNQQRAGRLVRAYGLFRGMGIAIAALFATVLIVGCFTPGGVRPDAERYAGNQHNVSTAAEKGSKNSPSMPFIDPDFRLAPTDTLGLSFYTRHEPLPVYPMQIGDTLLIEFHQQEYLNRNVVVQPDGRIPVPYMPPYMALGKTSDKVSEELTEQYRTGGIFNNVQVTVSILAFNARLREMQALISNGITGQIREVVVNQDGYMSLPMAGRVRVAGRCITDARDEIRREYETAMPGAGVDVELRAVGANFLYVLGEVNRPGPVNIVDPMGVVQAITAAGGYRTGADLTSVAVLRADDSNCPKGRLVNVRDILKDGNLSSDVLVKRFDIVYVPPHTIQKLNESIVMYIRNMMPLESTMQMSFDYVWGNEKNFSPF